MIRLLGDGKSTAVYELAVVVKTGGSARALQDERGRHPRRYGGLSCTFLRTRWENRHGQGTKTWQSRSEEAEIAEEETGRRAVDDHHHRSQEAMTGRRPA